MVYRQGDFFGRSPDDSVRDTKESEDEKVWKKQQAEKVKDQARKKRAAQRPATRMVVVASIRCERCRHWVRPVDPKEDPFGRCVNLGVLAKRVYGTDYERGQVLTMDQINALRLSTIGDVEYEALRCQPITCCSLFELGAYDPDADLTDEERDREWEELRQWAS